MFVRFVIIVASSATLISCTPAEIITRSLDVAGIPSHKEVVKLRNCSGPDASEWLCRKDAQKLTTDVNARVCKSDDTPCRYIPIDEASSFTRYCLGDSLSQDCWFEDPNT